MAHQKDALRIPIDSDGLQVNFCKNPVCPNFGRPASTESQTRGLYAKERSDSYSVHGGGYKLEIKCERCGEWPPIKSNLAIREEIERLSDCLTIKPEPTCPSKSCDNRFIGLSTPEAYYSFGKTKSGSQRYRCRLCNTTFAISDNPTFRQKHTTVVNELIFKLLMNKMPLKRICETAGVAMGTLYRKINFIHKQCLAFAASYERRLPEMKIPRLYLSVDRQDYVINWVHADDKRNIVLTALGTADNKTSYVFGIHVNYDAGAYANIIEKDAEAIGDYKLRPPFRRYARVWLGIDYLYALGRNTGRRGKGKRLRDTIEAGYTEAVGREDVENPDIQTTETSLPYEGMLVHSDYTLHGHFFFLRDLLANVEKIRFFLDQESGIRAACFAAFWTDVLSKRCDAYYVRVNKDLTINQKRRLKASSVRALAEFRASSASYEPLTDYDLQRIVIKQRLRDLVDIGKWHDRWLFYPFPDMSEPEKAICWLTNLYDNAYDDDHLAHLYCKATLHGIDRFFMQVRRRISLLERPIATASAVGRKWYGYSPYNPALVGKVLDIFRVFYNYVEVGDDKKTPAMRIGLLEKTTTLNQILACE